MHRLKITAGVLALALLSTGAGFAGVDTGSADFTTYVALGDSLTAGFSNGSILDKFQINSYPALIYRQVNGTAPGVGFQQPLVSAPGLPGALRLTGLFPTMISATPGAGTPENLTLPRPYNNLAVPGATLHDLLTKTHSTSASDPTDLVLRGLGGGTTQLQQALSLTPTFATLWIGNNDALAAATSGIAIEGVTLTPPAQFNTDITTVTAALTAAGVKFAIGNVPDVTSIPFVTTIPRFVVNPANNQLVLDPTGNPIPLIGPNGPLQAGDFVLLTAAAELGTGRGIPTFIPGGTGQPLTDDVVLNAAEVATIKSHVAAYNASIAAAATNNGAALVDANSILTGIATNGLNIGGIPFSSAFLTGGIFGYDGVHPTPFGYAYIANQFIAAINTEFGAQIPAVNLRPFIFGPLPSGAVAGVTEGKRAGGTATSYSDYILTPEARRNLLLSVGVPQWIVDGTKPPAATRKPRKPRG
jgi:phospholipase/lecithinase/hemolysin